MSEEHDGTSPPGIRTIPAAEVALHKDGNDCWIIIRGKVYDITNFLPDHPGGEDMILEFAGKDATEGFENVGHSDDAKSQLEQLLIGVLEPSKKEATKHLKKGTTKSTARSVGGDDIATSNASSSLSLFKFFVPAVLAISAAILAARFIASHTQPPPQ